MASQVNGIHQAVPVGQENAAVAMNLSDLPKTERRRITTELMRIHNLVNAAEHDLRKMGGKDKADSLRID